MNQKDGLKRIPWSESSENLLSFFGTTRESGLTDYQVNQKSLEFGLNILRVNPPPGKLEIFWKQLKNPMVLTLGVAALISIFVGESLDAIAILLILIINAFIGYFQENKSINAIEALKNFQHRKSV